MTRAVRALAIAAILALTGCATQPGPTTQAVATASEPAGTGTPTVTPAPTETPIVASSSAPETSPAPTTPAPTPALMSTATPAPAATPKPSARPTPTATHATTLAWSQAYLPRPPGAASLGGSNARTSDITVGGPGLVIVGTDLDARGSDVAASWTSADGIDWQEHLTGLTADHGFGFAAVAAGGGALVAVGAIGIWRSTDGRTWDQVGGATMLGSSTTDVAWGPAEFVAIGSPAVAGSTTVWRSPDGRAWEPGIVSAALSGFCASKVAGGANGYIAIGSDCGSPPRPVIAWSADGRSWVRAPRQSSLSGEGSGSGVVAGGPGWIAFGTFTPMGSTASGTAVWTSRDGLAWRRTSFLQPLPPYVPDCGNSYDHAAMNDIARLGPGYVAVGVATCGNDLWGAAWASPDGATWHSVRLSPTTDARFWSMFAVAARGGRLVAAARGPWIDYLPAAVSAVIAP